MSSRARPQAETRDPSVAQLREGAGPEGFSGANRLDSDFPNRVAAGTFAGRFFSCLSVVCVYLPRRRMSKKTLSPLFACGCFCSLHGVVFQKISSRAPRQWRAGIIRTFALASR